MTSAGRSLWPYDFASQGTWMWMGGHAESLFFISSLGGLLTTVERQSQNCNKKQLQLRCEKY